MSPDQFEDRLVKLETQVRRWKFGFKSILFAAVVLFLTVGASALQVSRADRFEANEITVHNLILKDDAGHLRGFLDGGSGYSSPSLKFLDAEQNTSISLEAGPDVATLFLSAGGKDKGPTMNLWASRKTLLPSGISITDANRKERVDIAVNNGDMDGLSHIALSDKSGNDVVYLSSTPWGGNMELHSTEGSVELGADLIGSGLSEPLFSIRDRLRNERIRIGIEKGVPKLQTLDPEKHIGWEAGTSPSNGR